MKSQKVWLITGASKGFGFEIAKAALQAGDKVAAENPPLHLPIGSDAIAAYETMTKRLAADVDAWRLVSTSTDHEYQHSSTTTQSN
jgi:NAD(P)-dependent dehydrogenase (short-subunit alcohol dehydrogenase family)